MDWNLLREIESKGVFPSDPSPMANSSFDSIQPLSCCNLSQWDAAKSTSFSQFDSYNFATTPFEDQNFHSWKMLDASCNFVPTSLEDLEFEGSKFPNNLEKGMSELINGSGFQVPGTLNFKECVEGVPDCGVLGLDQADDIFMNSLSDQDIRDMVNTVEPSQQVVNPCNKEAPSQDILANLLNDPINNVFCQDEMTTINDLDTFAISVLSEDLPVNSSMMSQGYVASDSSNMMNPKESIMESRMIVPDVATPKIFEATVLCELEAALSGINERTRICFRDAFYRLANDSKVSRDETKNKFLEFHYEPSFNTNSNANFRAYRVQPVEKETNVIDRAVVNLLLNPSCTGPPETWAPHGFHTNIIPHMNFVNL
ncbi:Serine hydroxymethyltransferase 1 [Rhynchospora pubera]|uniref:Serine hydroxymethyltransferase 1 n=1 Tax=Rhynchospora pubera TaxID=906938 RepID=A0AAV8EAA5_9POAL|nr:Serine hydroxymethyltransferase 1 [Rhynchospora pubera]